MDVSVNVGRLSAPASAFISKPHKLLIDGKWVAPKGGKSFKVFDPATGVQIAQVAEGGPEDIDLAVKAARKAFGEGPWSKIKPVERGKMVWRLGDLLEKHLVELAEIESLDNGKPVSDAKAVDLPFACELLRVITRFRQYRELLLDPRERGRRTAKEQNEIGCSDRWQQCRVAPSLRPGGSR
jgi:acyl-CoA reductase-like NAD-dependent aldehyde dehydrogenase